MDTHKAWEEDICPVCGSEVEWEIDHAGALTQTWLGLCGNSGCNEQFEAELESALKSVRKR